jgi:hypothetical protein
MDDRYDKDYVYGNVRFHLADFVPDVEECRILMLKVLEQAIRDYMSLQNSELPNDREAWESARDFLYDDEYRLKWGDMEISTEEYLDIIDLDINWVRDQTTKKLKSKDEQNG